MNGGWGTGTPLPASFPCRGRPHYSLFAVGPLLREAVIERRAQQVVEQQDGSTPQLKPLPPSQALPVAQEAQTGERRRHSQGQPQEEQGCLPAARSLAEGLEPPDRPRLTWSRPQHQTGARVSMTADPIGPG